MKGIHFYSANYRCPWLWLLTQVPLYYPWFNSKKKVSLLRVGVFSGVDNSPNLYKASQKKNKNGIVLRFYSFAVILRFKK